MNAILILAAFLFFAALMYARLMPAILAVPSMAIVMALCAGVPASALGAIVTNGASALSPAYVAVIFGALLGRVTLDTGIARALVSLAAEYGGENPFAFALVLCAIVAVLFTSLNGLGAIIMVGSIVLPIMMTTGVPRTVAAPLFLMAFALGFIFNIANWTFYTTLFHVTEQQLIRYALLLAAIDAVVLLLYAVIAFRRERDYAAWAIAGEGGEERTVPWWSLVTPLLPIVLYFALHIPATPAFAVSALFGALATRPRKAIATLVASAIRGVEDVAPAIVLFIGIGMLLVATSQPQFEAALHPLVAGGWIRNPFAYVVIFGFLSPLVLYRGPLNPFGVGIAIFTALLSAHALPPLALVAAVMAVVQVQNVCDPTNTQNVWVANFTGVPIATITKRTLPFQVAVAIAATIVVVLAPQRVLGQSAFPGMESPPGAAYHVAVDDDGTALARVAADVMAQGLRGSPLPKFAVLRVHEDPNAADCSRKRYAAYVKVTSSTFGLVEGTDLDVGVTLEDCGGWIVDEWHNHEIETADAGDDARHLAARDFSDMMVWLSGAPAVSRNLFTYGVALSPSSAPSFFYSLFKTPDGNMRVYVRAGGPAYAAGLRTGDVIEDIDGQPWWSYGTFPTQSMAYDGKPHAFEVRRNGKTVDVQLGEPFDIGDAASRR